MRKYRILTDGIRFQIEFKRLGVWWNERYLKDYFAPSDNLEEARSMYSALSSVLVWNRAPTPPAKEARNT